MANPSIWPGSSSFSTGSNPTPFGFYDTDVEFQTDADKVSNFCARRLGYPLVDVELQDISFYAVFEEAVTTYGNELYAYKIRDNQLSVEGLSTGSLLNKAIITPNFEPIVKLSEQYGSEAGSGGNIEYYTGSIEVTGGKQDYDLKAWASSSGVEGEYGIEVKRVFYESPPAIVKYFDPYSGTGFGYQNLMESFGFGGMSPAINFLMMPLNYDLQVLQAIEMNDMVRRSNFSFELRNNTLKVFPIPRHSGSMYFEYIKRDERINNSVDQTPDRITNVSDAPYDNPTYSNINSVGRQWVFEYTLALSKEVLGYVRGKYQTIPIPGAEVQLNQNDLIAAGTAEKNTLLEKLRGYFDETSRKALLERRAQEAQFTNEELKNVPYTIYIA